MKRVFKQLYFTVKSPSELKSEMTHACFLYVYSHPELVDEAHSFSSNIEMKTVKISSNIS